MPFPLAHPAAVLPLKKYCPKPLNFVALVMGSMSPDAGYLFGGTYIEELSHNFLGGTAFGLIVGFVLLALFYSVTPLGLKLVSPRTRQVLLPLVQWPGNSIAELTVSILLGVWTHLLLDSFSHAHGWLASHWTALLIPVFTVAGRHIRVCHLLWYGFSFAGIGLLALASMRWRDRTFAAAGPGRTSQWVVALLVATLLLPIEVFHHLVRSKVGLVLVAAMTLALLLVLLFGLALRKRSISDANKCGGANRAPSS